MQIVLSVLLTLSLLLTACGGKSASPASDGKPSNELAIPADKLDPRDFPTLVNESTGFQGNEVFDRGNNRWCFRDCGLESEFLVSGDGKTIYRIFGKEYYKVIGDIAPAEPRVFLEAAKLQFAKNGLDPNLIKLYQNERGLWVLEWPNLGISLPQYISRYGVNEAKVTDYAIENRMVLYRDWHVADIADPKLANDVIDPRTGDIFVVDWEYARVKVITPTAFDEYPLQKENDYFRFLREGYAPVFIWDAVVQPEIGANFRGKDVFQVRIGEDGKVWGAFADDSGNVTWYSYDGRVVTIAREFKDATEITPAISQYADDFTTGTGMAVRLYEEGGKVYMESGDLGVPYDSLVIYGPQPTLEILKADAQAIEDLYVSLYRDGIGYTDQLKIGTRNIVKQGGILANVDYEGVVNPADSLLPHLKDEATYRLWVRQVLREDFSALASDFGYSIDEIVPLAGFQSGVQVVTVVDDLTEVAIWSRVDGKTYIAKLNPEELAWLRAKDPRVLNALVREGIPMPKATPLEIGFNGLGVVITYAGVIYAGVQAIDAINEHTDMGPEVEPNERSYRMDLTESQRARSEELSAHGFEKSALYYVYSERTPQQVSDLFELRSDTCYDVKLDNPQQNGFVNLFGFSDYDVYTPIRICGGTNWATYINYESGEVAHWEYVNNVWTLMSGPACSRYHVLVNNSAGTESVFTEVQMCISPDQGSHTPMLWDFPQ